MFNLFQVTNIFVFFMILVNYNNSGGNANPENYFKIYAQNDLFIIFS